MSREIEIGDNLIETNLKNTMIIDNTNQKVLVINNIKYQKEELITLKVNDIKEIAKECNICLTNVNKKNKEDLINDLLGKTIDNTNSTIKKKLDDANKRYLETKKKIEDKEKQKNERKKRDDDKIAKENEKKKRDEYEKTKIIKNYLTNEENNNIETNTDNTQILEANILYKPYFEMTFYIDEISRIKLQKKQSESINLFKSLIKYCIYDVEDKNINLSVKTEPVGDYETKYICKAIVNGYKAFPYLINNKIKNYLTDKSVVKHLNKLNIDNSNFNFDIYKEGYDLNNFIIKKDDIIDNVYILKGDEETCFNINQGDNINNYEKKIMDKIYKAKEFYDRKAILYIYHNANKIGNLIYNKVNDRKIYKQSKEDFCNHLKNQMSMLLNALTSTKNNQNIYFKPDNNSLNSRKYAIQPVSYQNIMREIRHTIAKDYYIDIDMKNAHFNLLKHLINTRDYIDGDKCKSILDYAENRQFYIDDIVKNYPNTNKDIVKQVFLSMMYNEDLDKYDYSKCEWFKNFIREFKYLQNCLYEADEFKEHIDNTKKSIEDKIERFNKKHIRYDEIIDYNYFKNNKEIDDLNSNIKGKVLSRILQEQENIVLECLIKFLDEKGIIYSSLQYDGLQLLLPNKYEEISKNLTDFQKKLKLDNKLLDDISKYIKDELNINIEFHYKILDEGIELPNDYKNSYEREYILKDYNETDIADLFIRENKHILNIDNDTGSKYIKKDNIWSSNEKTFQDYTKNILKDMKIYVLENKYDEIMDNYKYKSGKMTKEDYAGLINKINKYNINSTNEKLSKILKGIELRNDYGDDDFSFKLNNSTIGKICFNDGVYFMKEKVFKKYPVEEVVSTIKLKYDFPNKTDKIEKMMSTIFNLFLGAYHENDRDLFEASLKIHARTIGGHFRDKYWNLEYGERNSGKGLIQSLFEKTFGCYVKSMKYDRICNNQTSTDASKDNYWLIDFRFARWVYVSEIPNDKVGNGTFIKSIASGGDSQTGRNFRCDIEKTFIPHFSLSIYCNGFPKIQPRDCFNNCNLIRTHYGFDDDKVKEGNSLYKNYVKIEDLDPKEYFMKNENICRDAFLWLILDHYEDKKFERIPKMIEQLQKNNEIYNQKDIVSIINEYFEKAEDGKQNRLTKNDICSFKRNLYDTGDRQLGIMKDGELLDKLGKFYEYKKQRCKSNDNKPCYCFTGIKIKNEYLKNFNYQFIKDDEDDEENEEDIKEGNEELDIEIKHLVPKKRERK